MGSVNGRLAASLLVEENIRLELLALSPMERAIDVCKVVNHLRVLELQR